MRLEHFVDYCAELNLDACEPTSYYFPETVTRDYLLKLKRQAFNLGLDISGTAIGNDFGLKPGPERDEQLAMCREWIEHSAIMGAPVIRIFAGKTPPGDTDTAAIDRCIEGINECLKHAADYGVFLALENHGGITSTPEQMLSIIAGVDDSPWFGVNFDSGNFKSDDPYRDLEKIAPYTVNAQIKVAVTRNGTKEPSDFARVIDILKDANYRGYVVLEYEEAEDPKVAIPRYIDQLRELMRS
jgi:sugar phosphate isomerase/epimerase